MRDDEHDNHDNHDNHDEQANHDAHDDHRGESAPDSQPQGDDEDPSVCNRRRFLNRVILTVGGVAVTASGVPIAGLVLSPYLGSTKERWRDVGPLDRIEVGQTRLVHFRDASSPRWAGISGQSGAWIRREAAQTVVAFSISCRHLGCPIRWEQGPQLFMCPCHGGVYYKDGSVAAGPPPTGLARYNTRIKNQRIELYTRAWPLTLTTRAQL